MALQYARFKQEPIQDVLALPLSALLVNYAIEVNRRAEERYHTIKALPIEEQAKYPDVRKEIYHFVRKVKTISK